MEKPRFSQIVIKMRAMDEHNSPMMAIKMIAIKMIVIKMIGLCRNLWFFYNDIMYWCLVVLPTLMVLYHLRVHDRIIKNQSVKRAVACYVNGVLDWYLMLLDVFGMQEVLCDQRSPTESIRLQINSVTIRSLIEDVNYPKQTIANLKLNMENEGYLELSKYFPQEQYQSKTETSAPHMLVDISYQVGDDPYMFTTLMENGTGNVPFYKKTQVQNHPKIVCDEIVCNGMADKANAELSDLVNRYLGPIGDFHHGLCPIKMEWIKPDLTSLTVTTSLLETKKFIQGDYLCLD